MLRSGAMSAIRLPVLSAFAGGCLCSAVLFGVWRADSGASTPATKQQRPHDVELVTAAVAAPSAAQPHDLFAGVAAEHVRNGAGEPTSPATQPLDSAEPEPTGSAVSVVLMNLEAAYRARVAPTAPMPASTQERAVAAAGTDNAAVPTEPPPQTGPQPVAAVIPISPAPAVAPAAFAPAPFVAPVAPPPPIAAAPAYVAQADSPPSEVHIGDVNQNTYNITNVRQGDLYLIQMQQMQQMQQLATLQYLQLLGMSSGVAAPAQRVRGARAQSTPFRSTITNPDNPWGLHFSPPNLVH